MKTAGKYLSILLLSVCFISSCDVIPDPATYFDRYTAELEYLGGVVEVTVISNGAWELTCDEDGVVVAPTSGYGDTPVTVTVPENKDSVTTAVRVWATTTIDSTSHAAKLAIALGARPFVVCRENVSDIPSKGGIIRFYVNSNYPWSVVECKYGDGSHFDGTIVPSKWNRNGVWVEVNVPTNTTGMQRTVAIKLQLDSYSFATESLQITQSE